MHPCHEPHIKDVLVELRARAKRRRWAVQVRKRFDVLKDKKYQAEPLDTVADGKPATH